MAGATQLPLLKGCVLTLPTATFSGMLPGTISGCPYRAGGCVLQPDLLNGVAGMGNTSGCTACMGDLL